MRFGLPVLVLVILFCTAACMSDGQETSPEATPAGLRAFVEHAATWARGVDRATALSAINDRGGPFIHGDWYIYAYDMEGTLLAHPYEHARVGMNRMDWTTAHGLEFVRLATGTAARGGGYLLYMYPPPAGTGDINESAGSLYEVKLGYVAPVTDDWWLGSGLYYSDMEEGRFTEKVDDLVRYVDDAVDYARTHERSQALAAFNDPDGRYIFALDYNGTLLAYGANPGRVGQSDRGVVRAYGVKSADVSSALARKGGGFLVYSITNPATGAVEQKLSYVRPVDEDWWLGSGVYLSDLVTG